MDMRGRGLPIAAIQLLSARHVADWTRSLSLCPLEVWTPRGGTIRRTEIQCKDAVISLEAADSLSEPCRRRLLLTRIGQGYSKGNKMGGPPLSQFSSAIAPPYHWLAGD